MKFVRTPAMICVFGIIVISLYSSYIVGGVLESNAPVQVQFFLGTAHRDVVYCNSQTLDIFIPSEAPTRPLPLAVYVHGGGLTSGDKTNINPIFLNALAMAGYTVASVNYPLAPQFKFPVQIQDVKCAIRYLRENAQLYGTNGSEIFLFGEGYGGELVSLADLTGSHSAFDVGPFLNTSSSVLAAVDMFGPANLTGWIAPSDFQRVFDSNLTDLVLASPVHYITPKAPPIMIVQGMNDTKVPESQSIQFYNELRAAGVSAQLMVIQNSGHMFAQVGSKAIDPNLVQIGQVVVNFFQTYRGGSG